VHYKSEDSILEERNVTPPPDPRSIEGLAVLVVEDEPIVALDLQDVLEKAGAIVIGPASTLDQALELIASNSLDCAVLDVRLAGETSFPAARELAEKNIRWVFYTGNADEAALRKDWPLCMVISKPVPPKQLIAAIAASLQPRFKCPAVP
jgi:DNA-binding NarL/FixJ family response regulator